MFKWQRPVAPLTACLCVLALRASAAQLGNSQYSTSLWLSNGLTQSQHVDLNASPLQFSGLGYDVDAGFRRGLGRWTFATTFDGARRSYTTHLTAGTPSSETSYDGRLAVSLVREFAPSAPQGFGVGLFADARGGILRHQYTDPGSTIADYVNGVVSVGPQVTWHRSIGDGMARVDMGAPLFGFVHRPYSDTRQERPSPTVTFAGPDALHAFDAGISYETSQRRRLGLVAAYRFRALELPGPQSYRALSNTFSVGVVGRFGRRQP